MITHHLLGTAVLALTVVASGCDGKYPDKHHTHGHYTPQEEMQLNFRVEELVEQHQLSPLRAREVAEEEMHSTETLWGFFHMLRNVKSVFNNLDKRANDTSSVSTDDGVSFTLLDFPLFTTTPPTPLLLTPGTSTPLPTTPLWSKPASSDDEPSSDDFTTDSSSAVPTSENNTELTSNPETSNSPTPTDTPETESTTTNAESTTEEIPEETTTQETPRETSDETTENDNTLKTAEDTTPTSLDSGHVEVTTIHGLVVTVTSTSKAEPLSATNDKAQSKSTDGGLSQTNKIVVGVVVGVGGALILGVLALLFYLRKRKHAEHESGKWTFWKKDEKGTDEFLSGELGVRDRNINQGSNF